MGYLLEKSNSHHPGICILQDGKSVREIMPIVTFVESCNRAGDLLDTSLPFLSFIATAFKSKEAFNKYLITVSRLNEQFGDFILQMKQKGLPVSIPDAEYWNEEFDRITKAVDSGAIDKVQGSQELANSFGKTMLECIDENIKVAKPYGINPPISSLEKREKTNK